MNVNRLRFSNEIFCSQWIIVRIKCLASKHYNDQTSKGYFDVFKMVLIVSSWKLGTKEVRTSEKSQKTFIWKTANEANYLLNLSKAEWVMNGKKLWIRLMINELEPIGSFRWWRRRWPWRAESRWQLFVRPMPAEVCLQVAQVAQAALNLALGFKYQVQVSEIIYVFDLF